MKKSLHISHEIVDQLDICRSPEEASPASKLATANAYRHSLMEAGNTARPFPGQSSESARDVAVMDGGQNANILTF